MWTDTDRTHIFKRGSDEIVINDVVFLSDSQLRDIFKNAGVHVYLDSGDVFYIGRNWLCIHSVFGGKKTLKFPFYTQIINPENGKKLSDRTNFFELNMESKSTIILRLNPLN